MTTNKPEVKRYTPAYSVDSVMRGHLFMEECERGAWVSLEDHKALKAECEKLREHLQNLIDQTTHLEPVPGNPMWSRRIQLDEVIAECDSLRDECEKLRKDAEATQESVKLLNYLFARNIIAMQSAVIEWEKGKGAAAGMQWIWNTLFGPGQIPDEEETDAQAYFDSEIEPLDAAMQETTK